MERGPREPHAQERAESTQDGHETLDTEAALLAEAYGSLEEGGFKDTIRTRIEDVLLDLREDAKSILMGVTIVAALLSANHQRTRYTVEEIQEPSGASSYEHSDHKTTETIAMLTGMQAPTPEQIQELQRMQVISFYTGHGIPPPHYTERTTTEEMLRDMETLMRELHTVREERVSEEADRMLNFYAQPRTRNPELYRILWQMLQENGAPQIRFYEPTAEPNLLNPGRAHYQALSNTVYISPQNPLDDFTAEVAHAQQFDRRFFDAYFRTIRDITSSHISGIFRGETDMFTNHDTLYGEVGSIEHEAHSVIEPRLREQLGDRRIVFADNGRRPRPRGRG